MNIGNIRPILLTWLWRNKDDPISCDRSSLVRGMISVIYTIRQHDRETNYHSINLTVLTPRLLYISSTLQFDQNGFTSCRVVQNGIADKKESDRWNNFRMWSTTTRRGWRDGVPSTKRSIRSVWNGTPSSHPRRPPPRTKVCQELGSTPPSPLLVCPLSSGRDSRDGGRFSRSFSSSSSSSLSSLSIIHFQPSHRLTQRGEAISHRQISHP